MGSLGRSLDGLSSKLHLVVDAFGRPPRVVTLPGNCGDVLFAGAFITGRRPEYVIAAAPLTLTTFARLPRDATASPTTIAVLYSSSPSVRGWCGLSNVTTA